MKSDSVMMEIFIIRNSIIQDSLQASECNKCEKSDSIYKDLLYN